jgi:hypothetical protein
MADIRQQYAGTLQWMKAPNGQPTKLTEKQWLQVRTPAFKQWFGDWETAAKIEGIKNKEPVTVTIREALNKKEAEEMVRPFGAIENASVKLLDIRGMMFHG